MVSKLESLLKDVAVARKNFLDATAGLSEEQARFRPDELTWSVIDNVEHLFWAEFGGINGMWKVLEATRRQQPVFTGERVHEGLPIEQVIERTWKEKEQVPEIAKPKWGGPLAFWRNALESLQPQLARLAEAITEEELTSVIHPHPISGPINVIQRFEFLRFHMNRHQGQVERLRASANFPK
ncbi:MAG: DinB family protein [Cyclobacteriaceae bacterium]|nr:DinB family protein [Cyclobacteriaceae bacterium]